MGMPGEFWITKRPGCISTAGKVRSLILGCVGRAALEDLISYPQTRNIQLATESGSISLMCGEIA